MWNDSRLIGYIFVERILFILAWSMVWEGVFKGVIYELCGFVVKRGAHISRGGSDFEVACGTA